VVFVPHLEDHTAHQEWVYNRVDLETAHVVFARTLGPDADQRLMAWFPEHRPLVLEVGDRSLKLQRYPHLDEGSAR